MAKQYYKREELVFVNKLDNKNFKDLTNKRFGRLKVIGYAGMINNKSRWYCECDCSLIAQVRAECLTKGFVRSCGCYNYEKIIERNTTHGMSYSAENRIYRSAKKRCKNSGDPAYKYYGGRGLTFEFETFEKFILEVGVRPSCKHTLDRIDNDKGYVPGNVRWVLQKEQCNNMRTNRYILIDGVTKTLAQWMGGSRLLIYKDAHRKITQYGWCDVCAVKRLEDCTHKTDQAWRTEAVINAAEKLKIL